MTIGKTIALSIPTFVSKVMSLLFNMLSSLFIAFLPRSKHLLISWLQSPSAVILGPKKIKSLTVSIVSPSMCHEMTGPDAKIFIFWVLTFKPAFSLSFFTYIKRLFSSSSLSANKGGVIYVSEFIDIFFQQSWFQLVIHPAWHFTWCALHISLISRVTIHTPFPIWNQSVVPCLVLTVTSWPTYRFLRRQVRSSGIPISLRIFQFVMIDTVKGFTVVSEAEVYVFLSHFLSPWSNECWQFSLWFLCLF